MDVGKYFWQRPCRYEQCDFFKHMLKWSKSHSVMSASFATPWTSPWNSPVQTMGVGNCFLLQGIFPTQGLNPGFPHSGQMLYQLSHWLRWSIVIYWWMFIITIEMRDMDICSMTKENTWRFVLVSRHHLFLFKARNHCFMDFTVIVLFLSVLVFYCYRIATQT